MRIRAIGLTALSLTIISSSLAAAPPTKGTFNGTEAFARFTGTIDGCLDTFVLVEAVNDGKGNTPQITAFGTVYNFCTSTQVHDFLYYDTLKSGTFTTSKKGDSATLTTTIPNVHDNALQRDITITIDLTWSATGAPAKFHGSTHLRSSNYHYFFLTKSASQFDASVTGTVSDGVMNFLSAPETLAYISSSSTMYINYLKY